MGTGPTGSMPIADTALLCALAPDRERQRPDSWWLIILGSRAKLNATILKPTPGTAKGLGSLTPVSGDDELGAMKSCGNLSFSARRSTERRSQKSIGDPN